MNARVRPALATLALGIGSAFGVGACVEPAEPPAKTPGSPTSPAPVEESGKTMLKGMVTLTQSLASYAPRGRLAVGWVTEEELPALERGGISMHLFRELATARMVPTGSADFLTLATSVPYELQVPDQAVVPFVVLDVCGDVYRSMMGGCDGSVLGFGAVAHPKHGAVTTADVALSKRVMTSPSPEGCVGDRMQLVHIDAPKTAGAVHNDTARRVCVRLPPGYAKHPGRRYPVIYALPGLEGTDVNFFQRKVDLEAIESDTGREAIFVSIDTKTAHGSSYLVDSPTEGDFESFVASDVLSAIDKGFRTLTRAKGRGLIGQSTGGFNAVSFGLRHLGAFSAIAAMSPDGLDLGSWLAPDGKTFAPHWLHMLQLEDGMRSAGEMASLAASFSPNPASPRGFDWPCDPSTGVLDDAVWRKWLAYSPSVLITQPKILEEAKATLSGRFTITAAEADEFDLAAPAKRFYEEASTAGIGVTFTPTKGGHTDGIEEREKSSVKALLEALDPAKP